MIHPTACVHARAQIDPTAQVGPYAVIDEDVVVGAGCQVGPHVYLTGCTQIGPGNRFHAGCVIGDAPQDLKYRGERTRLRIGSDNVFREHVTVHRSASVSDETVLGSHNFLMANVHIGHNSHLGDHIIIANGTLLGGHVTVEDRAVISGNCLLHQFARVGTLAMMQGSAGISKDLPPFTVARGHNTICGLNTIGLRRAGVSSPARLELRRLYHALFRSRQRWQVALDQARQQFTGEHCALVIEFVAAARRGVCSDIGKAATASPADELPDKAGAGEL